MAAPLTASQVIAALKKFKVPYKEYPGWQTRTRPGTITPIGFMIHHTAGGYTDSDSYMKFLFVDGRPDVPGPLCNFAIGGSGTVYIGSRGRTNNAGAGSWATRQKVGAESYSGYSSEISPGPDDYSSANGLYWGVEICYGGSGATQIKPAQYASAVKLAAALMDAYGWSALSTIGHREHSRRKVDPGSFTMYKFRSDVRALLNGQDGDDMPTAQEVADAVWAKVLHSEVSDKAVRASTLLQKAHLYSYGAKRSTTYPLGNADGPTPRQAWSRAEARTALLIGLVQAQLPLLEAAASSGEGLTPEQVAQLAASVREAVEASLEEIDLVDEAELASEFVDELHNRIAPTQEQE